MSGSKLDIVRDLLVEWNRGDTEAVIHRATEDFEWHPVLVASVEGRVYRGHDGFREFLGEWQSTWETWNLEAEEMREFGDQVLVLTRVLAKGRGSGVELDQQLAHLFEFREGMVCRAETFMERDKALEVAESRATDSKVGGS
jgi:ketosteroid isomerase-like protein